MPPPLPSRIRAELFSQLATMELAGLPAAKAWSLLKLSTRSANRLQVVQKAVARGDNPAVAAQNAGLFSALEGALVRTALAAGSPARTYQRLAESCGHKASNEGKIRARLVLPAAVLVLALFIQPVVHLVEGSLTAGGYLAQVLKPLLAVVTIALLAARLAASTPGRPWLLRLPFFGPAIARGNARNFFESLALLLEAGVPMFEALPIAVTTIDNTAMRQAFGSIKPRMLRGAPLSIALAQEIANPLFLGSPHTIDFVTTGESSGTLPEMLLRQADALTQDLNRFWQNVADWLPRIAYAGVACWMAYGLLTGAGVGPRVPTGI